MENATMSVLKPRKTHGLTGTMAYQSWIGMRQRCYNPNAWNYGNYGGRGIQVCERWIESFENFFADLGERPSKQHSLGRIDNDSGYSPDNCRWETALQQRCSKRPPNWRRVKFERSIEKKLSALSDSEYGEILRKRNQLSPDKYIDWLLARMNTQPLSQ